MDDRAANAIRRLIARDLDQVAAEVAALRAELAAMRRGAEPPPMSPVERRAAVQALRARGLSYPKIAEYLGASKSTVHRDAQGIVRPRETRGPYRRATAARP